MRVEPPPLYEEPPGPLLRRLPRALRRLSAAPAAPAAVVYSDLYFRHGQRLAARRRRLLLDELGGRALLPAEDGGGPHVPLEDPAASRDGRVFDVQEEPFRWAKERRVRRAAAGRRDALYRQGARPPPPCERQPPPRAAPAAAPGAPMQSVRRSTRAMLLYSLTLYALSLLSFFVLSLR